MDRSKGFLEPNLSARDRNRVYKVIKAHLGSEPSDAELDIEMHVTTSGGMVKSRCIPVILSSKKQVAKRESEDIRRDICHLLEGNHPHIERFIGDFSIIGSLHTNMRIVLKQSITGKELPMYLAEITARLTLTQQARNRIRKMFPQLISALHFIHKLGICHGEITPSKIICYSDEIYLSGFSFQQRLDTPTIVSHSIYCAPETERDHTGSKNFQSLQAQDIFALGLVFAELLTILLDSYVEEMRESLHRNHSEREPYHRWLAEMDTWFADLESLHGTEAPQVGTIYKSLVVFMIHRDPQLRPNARDLSLIVRARGSDLFAWTGFPPDGNLPADDVPQELLTGWQVGQEKFLWEENAKTSLQSTPRGVLGRGRMAEVDEVVVSESTTTLARKRVFIARVNAPDALKKTGLRDEIETLRSLDHPHIVKVVGCYQEPIGRYSANFNILLHPAGDNDLRMFLEDICREALPRARKEYVSWLKSWFFCLSSALAYLHHRGIHHEDIKPANIIHRGQVVYFTDFGSSRRIIKWDETSTESPAAATRLFAAPEAMYEDGHMSRHGSKTDVYSLGLVFVEMLTVILGREVDDLREYVFSDAPGKRQYHRVKHRLVSWFDEARDATPIFSTVLSAMLRQKRTNRLNAQAVADRFVGLQGLDHLEACGCRWIRWEISKDSNQTHNYTSAEEDDEFVIV